MKEKFIISIVTPFYRGNQYLFQLFSSIDKNSKILKQKYPHAVIELIIVNDSPEVSIAVPELDISFNYIIIEHKKNLGIHQARVTGLEKSNGEYVIFLDQDDLLMDNAVLSQISIIHTSSNEVIVCNAYIEKEDGSFSSLYRSYSDYKLINDLNYYLKSHNVIKSPGQCIIKKRCIPNEWKNNIVTKNGSDDLFLWILLLEKGIKFVVNKECLYIHNYTGKNVSEDGRIMNSSTLGIVDLLKMIDYIPQKHIKLLKESRLFSSEYSSCRGIRKLKVVMNNIGLYLYLMIKKIIRVLI